MDAETWIKLIIAILSGLAAAVPLVFQLIKFVKQSVKAENWSQVVALVLDYMEAAETMFADGASRKDWVLSMTIASANRINYDLDDAALAKISDMIDNICAAAKVINATSSEVESI